MSNAAITPTYNEFKRIAADFMQAAPTLNIDELDNAWKCMGLAYLGCQHEATPLGNYRREIEAPLVLAMAGRLRVRREVELTTTTTTP